MNSSHQFNVTRERTSGRLLAFATSTMLLALASCGPSDSSRAMEEAYDLESEADVASRSGDPARALGLWTRVIEVRPKHHCSYFVRAGLLHELGDDAAASRDLETALQLLDSDSTTCEDRASHDVPRTRIEDAKAELWR